MIRISAITFLIVFISFSFSSKDKFELEGLWKCEGYGRILEIEKSKIKTFDINHVSCIPYAKIGIVKYFKRLYKPHFIHPDTMIVSFGPTKYKYYRIKELPETCHGAAYKNSRILNFNSFIDSFRTFYSFSKERKLDWDKIKEKYRPQIDEEMNDLELLLVFDQIIKEVDDAHTKMAWIPDDLRKNYNDHKKQSSSENKFNYDSLWVEVQNKTATRHLKHVNNFNLNTALWGVTDDNLGYLQINDMNCYVKFNISNTLVNDKCWGEFESKWEKNSSDYQSDHQKNLHKLMKLILDQFKNTDGLILDFRFNEGGYSFNALDILSFFNDSTREIYSKMAKKENGFTKPYKVSLESQSTSYTKKIVLLTSHATLSAGEIFTLGSLNLPNITRIGNNTSGHFSSFCMESIPNGWTFNMSMQVCLDLNGNNYEVVGISPHIQTDTISSAVPFYRNLLQSEEDVTITKAIELLKK